MSEHEKGEWLKRAQGIAQSEWQTGGAHFGNTLLSTPVFTISTTTPATYTNAATILKLGEQR